MNARENTDSNQPIEDKSIEGSSEATTPYSGQPDDLHDLFEVHASTNSDEDDPLAALRNDPNYAALIRDLEYIAKEARNLFNPVQDAPSDKVWDKIASQLGAKPDDL